MLSAGDGPRQPAPAAMSASRVIPTRITSPRATDVPASPPRKYGARGAVRCHCRGRLLARWAAHPIARAIPARHHGGHADPHPVRDFKPQREDCIMKRALMTAAAAAVLAAAMPALAGYPIAWFDERYPFETNKARYAFPNPASGDTAAARAARASHQPYALTGQPQTKSAGWTMKVDTIGLYPRTIYTR